MRRLILLLSTFALTAVVVAENTSDLTIGVVATRLGEDDKLLGGTFEPTIQWTRQGKLGRYDFTAVVSAKETTRSGDFSYDLLGRLKRSIRGWIYDAQVDTSSSDFNTINAALRVTAPSNTLLSVDGCTNVEEQDLHFRSVGVEQPFVANEIDGVLRIKCPADSGSGPTTLQLDCSYRDTFISLDGNKDRQAMTVVQSFSGGHEAGPTITSDGAWQLSYARNLPNRKGAVIGIYRPHGALSLEYRGDVVSINLDVPLEGFYQIKEGARLSFRQSISDSLK